MTRPSGPWLGYPFTTNVLDHVELNPGDSTGEVVARVTENLLDSIQQDNTMDLKVPWPPVMGKPLGYFAAVMSKVDGRILRVGFQPDGHPLLSTEVSLSERQ